MNKDGPIHRRYHPQRSGRDFGLPTSGGDERERRLGHGPAMGLGPRWPGPAGTGRRHHARLPHLKSLSHKRVVDADMRV